MANFATLQKLNDFIQDIEDDEVYQLADSLARDYTKRVVANRELYDIFSEMADNFLADLDIIVKYMGNSNELYEKQNDVVDKVNQFIETARNIYGSMEEDQQAQFDESVQEAKEQLPMNGTPFQ